MGVTTSKISSLAAYSYSASLIDCGVNPYKINSPASSLEIGNSSLPDVCFENLAINDDKKLEEVVDEFQAGDNVNLDSKKLEALLIEENNVPYLADKYVDDPMTGSMNKIRRSHGKKHIGGGALKGKAKKEKKIIIGLSSRKNK